MKKIGILCASDTELEPFLTHIAFSQVTEKAMLKFYSQGALKNGGEISIVAVYSGVCKVNASIAAQLLIDVFHVDCIINAGTAGGMDESVQLFDTVISDRMLYHDVAEDILTEFHPWLKANYFQSDREPLRRRIAKRRHTLSALEQWSQANSLSKMIKGARSTKSMRRFALTWKRSALPIPAM